jgi:hypothetical protein
MYKKACTRWDSVATLWIRIRRIRRFRASWSGSVIICTGSWSFHHQVKKVRKTLISSVLWLFIYDFSFLKTDVNVQSAKKNILKAADKIVGSGSGAESVTQWYGSADPDLYHNVTDPPPWYGYSFFAWFWSSISYVFFIYNVYCLEAALPTFPYSLHHVVKMSNSKEQRTNENCLKHR